MTNIAICGANGKMGKNVYVCASSRKDCKVVAGIDIYTDQYADFQIVDLPSKISIKPDVIIDFSNPSSLDALLEYCISTGVALVIASTGYSDEQIEKIKVSSKQIPIFFTFNMSIGINLLVTLAKKAIEILGDSFDIEIIEKHHNQKIDAPSGTAIMLANAINETFDNSKIYIYDRHDRRQKRKKCEIGIHTIRGGNIVGEHDIIFAGNDEVITLSHSAASKMVFAEGAVNAAVFLKDKLSGLYDMQMLVKK